jgi:diguanylate cyclase (GGDEF)-like protein
MVNLFGLPPITWDSSSRVAAGNAFTLLADGQISQILLISPRKENAPMLGSRLSVSARFMMVLVIGFTFQACISVVSLLSLRESLLKARTAEVKHLLETAYSTVAFYHDQAAEGLMTDKQAQETAKDAVRAMRYDGSNYYFIWAMDGTGIAHGSHPEWEGHNALKPPDSTKWPVVSLMVAKLIQACQTPQKEGVAIYRIPKPGQTVPLDKIAYTRLFEPWGWSIGTGAYVDDIDATFRSRAWSMLSVSMVLISIASAVTFFVGKDLGSAMTRLTACVATVAEGELEVNVPEVDRRDEVGVMARALLVLRDNSREAVELRLDPLTALPTRKLLMDRLRQALAASARSGIYGGVLLIDMDKFKTVNDTHGHDMGDELLHMVAKRLTACVREADTVARLGGDEFVLLVVGAGIKEHEAVAAIEAVGEKVLAELGRPFYLGSLVHETSASVGMTVFRGDYFTAEELLKQADLAMYKSKEQGRNVCHFFDPVMEATVRERAALERELRNAIFEKQFELHFQAQVKGDGLVTGAEALIRWNHPLRGLVAPLTFIPLVEETGLIIPLGQWVLEDACLRLAAWAKRPETASLKLAVNVSTRQFQRPEFVDQLLAILDSTGADPHRLELELTESILVENVDEIISKMLALQSKGVGFVLDDFGTGYSSLSYLKRMPLDLLKVDRSFVRDILVNPNDAAIAKTVVALAHALGLEVLAEGVETAEQRDFLAALGCHSYQGYFFSKPLPLHRFEEFLSRSKKIESGSSVVAV